MRSARLLAALMLSLPLLATAGSGHALAEGSGHVAITAADGYFDPQVTRIAVGATVEWKNVGRNVHTITADDRSFDSGDVQEGGTYSHTFAEAGAYRYHCIYHGAQGGVGMSGIILVGDAPMPGRGTNIGPGREAVPSGPSDTIRVPQNHRTIQEAVDAARPGDLILIGPGVYHEAVLVLTPYLTLRGTDRNAVILDGDYMMANGVHVEEADGVVVENLTTRHYRLNGVFWNGVNGYRASYVTAYANGDYGLYAFNSTWGRLDHDYAAGNPDSGIYIGQCQPCHAVITDSVAVDNGVGYSGTNAGGDLKVVNSEWADNMSGIVPNTLDSERLAPQRGATIAGNWVHDNNNRDAPAKPLTSSGFGIGIVVTGGLDNLVFGNRVDNHEAYGIAVIPMLDANLWLTGGNRVTGNAVSRSGIADLVLGAFGTGGDCASDNAYQTTLPPLLELQNGCGTDGAGGAGARPGGGAMSVTNRLLSGYATALGGHAPRGNWETYPDAPAQPQMPDPSAAPVLAEPEVAVPGAVEIRTLDQIAAAGSGHHSPIAQEVTFMGLPLAAASPAALVIGLYGYAFPLILYVAWVVLSLWDLARRDDLNDRRRLAWSAGVLVVPLVGPLAYLLAGGSAIPRAMRLFLVVGGLAIFAVLTVLGFLLA
jgi:plastocyanin